MSYVGSIDLYDCNATKDIPLSSSERYSIHVISRIINSNQRHKKVAKTLPALSLAFFSSQSPFMIPRLLMYFNLVSPGLVWRAAQLMIFLNVALDLL